MNVLDIRLIEPAKRDEIGSHEEFGRSTEPAQFGTIPGHPPQFGEHNSGNSGTSNEIAK